MLFRSRVDWTVFWRRLSVAVRESAHLTHAFEPVQDLFVDRAPWQAWLDRYQQRLDEQGRDAQARQTTGERMLRTNPKFVLRNHLAETAIRHAQVGDFAEIDQLLHLLQSPFDEHPGMDAWADFPPDWAGQLEISCSS